MNIDAVSNTAQAAASCEMAGGLAMLLSPLGIVAIIAVSLVFFLMFELNKKKMVLEKIKSDNKKKDSELPNDPNVQV